MGIRCALSNFRDSRGPSTSASVVAALLSGVARSWLIGAKVGQRRVAGEQALKAINGGRKPFHRTNAAMAPRVVASTRVCRGPHNWLFGLGHKIHVCEATAPRAPDPAAPRNLPREGPALGGGPVQHQKPTIGSSCGFDAMEWDVQLDGEDPGEAAASAFDDEPCDQAPPCEPRRFYDTHVELLRPAAGSRLDRVWQRMRHGEWVRKPSS